jgi:hypothetical protein
MPFRRVGGFPEQIGRQFVLSIGVNVRLHFDAVADYRFGGKSAAVYFGRNPFDYYPLTPGQSRFGSADEPGVCNGRGMLFWRFQDVTILDGAKPDLGAGLPKF